MFLAKQPSGGCVVLWFLAERLKRRDIVFDIPEEKATDRGGGNHLYQVTAAAGSIYNKVWVTGGLARAAPRDNPDWSSS